MTNQDDATPTTPEAAPAPAATPKSNGGGVGRRFLIASTPVVVTLVSRTALAGGGKDLVCTKSAMASATYMSHAKTPLPQKCGCHPDVWYNHGATGCTPNVWDTCGHYNTASTIQTCFDLSGYPKWKCSSTFINGLAPTVTFKCNIGTTNNPNWKDCPADFTRHVVAAACNASSWGATGHYPLTVTGVKGYLNTNVWSKTPGSTTSMNTICNNAMNYFIGCLPT